MTAFTAWPEPIGPTWVIVLPRAREDRPGPLDVRRLAADEDRERRLLGALAAARDRRVDERDAALASRAAKSRVAAGEIVEQSMTSEPDRAPSATPVRAEQDGLDVGRVGDAHDDDVGGARRGRRAGGPLDAELVELRRTSRTSGSRPRRSNPARARLAAIAAPIVPSPTNAIRSTATSSAIVIATVVRRS